MTPPRASNAPAIWLTIRALSQAKAGMLAPPTYTGLVLVMIRGLVLFGEVPDGTAQFSALVIAGTGIYVWHRETRAHLAHAATGAYAT